MFLLYSGKVIFRVASDGGFATLRRGNAALALGLRSSSRFAKGEPVQHPEPLVDIHCHLLPGTDDGSKSWTESLEMARIAVAEGIDSVVATPHQLGSFSHNDGQSIRTRTSHLCRFLADHGVPLRVLPGADVRIEANLVAGIERGEVLTIADKRRHVLLELPHELYFPLEPVLDQLRTAGLVGILSHPERNQALLKQPDLLGPLVDDGCLMQITAGSLTGSFGPASQQLAERMCALDLAHFVATDAHGSKWRRPLMASAFKRVAALCDTETAVRLCRQNPALVIEGDDVAARPRKTGQLRRWGAWFGWRTAG